MKPPQSPPKTLEERVAFLETALTEAGDQIRKMQAILKLVAPKGLGTTLSKSMKSSAIQKISWAFRNAGTLSDAINNTMDHMNNQYGASNVSETLKDYVRTQAHRIYRVPLPEMTETETSTAVG